MNGENHSMLILSIRNDPASTARRACRQHVERHRLNATAESLQPLAPLGLASLSCRAGWEAPKAPNGCDGRSSASICGFIEPVTFDELPTRAARGGCRVVPDGQDEH